MRSIIIFLTLVFFLTSCGGLGDTGKVLRNEKITNTDEFLVQKKKPLVMPPNYSELPEPGSIQTRELNEKNKIKTLLKKEKNTEINSSKKSSSIENTILDKIKK